MHLRHKVLKSELTLLGRSSTFLPALEGYISTPSSPKACVVTPPAKEQVECDFNRTHAHNAKPI